MFSPVGSHWTPHFFLRLGGSSHFDRWSSSRRVASVSDGRSREERRGIRPVAGPAATPPARVLAPNCWPVSTPHQNQRLSLRMGLWDSNFPRRSHLAGSGIFARVSVRSAWYMGGTASNHLSRRSRHQMGTGLPSMACRTAWVRRQGCPQAGRASCRPEGHGDMSWQRYGDLVVRQSDGPRTGCPQAGRASCRPRGKG
jgi:hypothetical protein